MLQCGEVHYCGIVLTCVVFKVSTVNLYWQVFTCTNEGFLPTQIKISVESYT